VRLNAFGDSSLDILVLFHLSMETYTAELEVREEILLRIMGVAAEFGVAFAFPTRTLHVTGPTPDLGRPG
jgi:MscS family membrane protein